MSEILHKIRDKAVEEISAYISDTHNGTIVSQNDLQALRRLNLGVLSAWHFQLNVNNKKVPAKFVIDHKFPYSKPQIIVNADEYYMKYPHVEQNGQLCLFADHVTFSHSHPSLVAKYLINDAIELLRDCYSGSNRIDFLNEFQSYWCRSESSTARTVLSFIEPHPPNRELFVIEGKYRIIVGDEKSKLKLWYSNWLGDREVGQFTIYPGIFIWLDKPFYPEDYPQKGLNLIKLTDIGNSNLLNFSNNEIKNQKTIFVLFGFPTNSGPAFAGVSLPCKKRSVDEPLVDGFRNGKAPVNLMWNSGYSLQNCKRHTVERVDSQWIHSRGGGRESKQLIEKSVCIIGCGSLGADVAKILAKSGVGKLLLIDKENLSWDNVGRHVLGGGEVDHKKSESLRNYLKAQLPHLQIEFLGIDWIDEFEENNKLFEKFDLVISMTGNWGSDDALNTLFRKNTKMPPLIFGWFEAHGCAGHALSILDLGGCLYCGMDETGHFKRVVTIWKAGIDGELQKAPACGAYYQPYGVVQTMGTKMIVVESAIDILLGKIDRSVLRSWIGSRNYLDACEGDWNGEWLEMNGDPGDGQIVVNENWKVSQRCPLCR